MSEEKEKSSNTSADVKTFQLKNIQEIQKWVNYLGDPTFLELAEPIIDSNDKILVQKNTSLRKSSIEHINNREENEIKQIFIFERSKNFKNQCKLKLRDSLYKCLNPRSFHIVPELMKKATIDYLKVGDMVFETDKLLDLFVQMDMENKHILSHLGEMALMTTGVTEQILKFMNVSEKEKRNTLKLAYLVGLLHDISLKDDSKYRLKDIENVRENGHAITSKFFINNDLSVFGNIVGDLIEKHHREQANWDLSAPIFTSVNQAVEEALCFSEFFFSQIYHAQQSEEGMSEESSAIKKVFFTLGQTLSKGMFHPVIIRIMKIFMKRFIHIMAYGEDIGKLENKCLFNHSAVAYPTPRCTQVLCKDKKHDCKYIKATFAIKLINPTKTMGWAGDTIYPGEYPKCQLSSKLPEIPEELASY